MSAALAALTKLARQVRDLRADVRLLQGASVPSSPGYPRVLHLVAQDFGLPVAVMISHSRRRDIALARHVAFHVAHRTLRISMCEIGRLADRDHSSVVHGIHRIEAMCAAEPEFAARVAALINQIEFERSR